METLNISKENALKAFQQADKKGKELLETLFGKQILSEKITDRIKTFEDACDAIGLKLQNNNIEFKSFCDDKDIDSINAYAKLCIIARALNEGWQPDWTNSNEYKYQVWLTDYKAGFGFSRSCYGDWRADTHCGSRLCFKTRELAEYAGKQFMDLYNQYFTIK